MFSIISWIEIPSPEDISPGNNEIGVVGTKVFKKSHMKLCNVSVNKCGHFGTFKMSSVERNVEMKSPSIDCISGQYISGFEAAEIILWRLREKNGYNVRAELSVDA